MLKYKKEKIQVCFSKEADIKTLCFILTFLKRLSVFNDIYEHLIRTYIVSFSIAPHNQDSE